MHTCLEWQADLAVYTNSRANSQTHTHTQSQTKPVSCACTCLPSTSEWLLLTKTPKSLADSSIVLASVKQIMVTFTLYLNILLITYKALHSSRSYCIFWSSDKWPVLISMWPVLTIVDCNRLFTRPFTSDSKDVSIYPWTETGLLISTFIMGPKPFTWQSSHRYNNRANSIRWQRLRCG